MKKTVSLLLVLSMVFTLCACGAPAEAPAPQVVEKIVEKTVEVEKAALPGSNVVILYTNDIHCGVEDNIGIKGLADIKSAVEATGKQVILVDNGDAVQGGTIGTLSKGQYIIDIMNELGYAAATPGNHEFDYTVDNFLALTEAADFPYISANFTDADGNLIFDPYIIIEADGAKIAFVGASTPKTLVTSVPTCFMDENGEYIYGFCQDETGEKFYAAIQSAADDARAEGADYVFLMSHLGITADSVPYTSPELIAHTTGIDAVLDGHSHSVVESDVIKNAEGEDVLLSSTGTKLANVGCLTIGADGTLTTKLINTDDMSSLLDEINGQFEDMLNQVVAHTDVDLRITDPETEQRMVRSAETNFGDLCADAYRAVSGADIAIVNGGGIRDDIPAGDITYGRLIEVYPFDNELTVVEVTGQEILDALEFSASLLPGEFGGFQQVSGMSFTIDMSVASTVRTDANSMFVSVEGERRVKDVMVGDEPLDPAKTYTLASHAYELKKMGDGYSMFADNVLLADSVMLGNQVMLNYIVDILGGSVGEEYANPYGDGRISIING